MCVTRQTHRWYHKPAHSHTSPHTHTHTDTQIIHDMTNLLTNTNTHTHPHAHAHIHLIKAHVKFRLLSAAFYCSLLSIVSGEAKIVQGCVKIHIEVQSVGEMVLWERQSH